MFYSQFILAKKGPLGTIWIAAHLERKLRKNQVADTDIGFSVDSILFPEMPIALRLSSHLLLGVVRIYSRKVNYLFDDCSEALLKVKQAFRSTAVDLPPEESTAPYHSITLPETFDLDDFELPDSEIYQGNYVDHHISSKEQITLQDTMDGVVYSTSNFGLDERFGDGDAYGLDLDEELLVGKAASAEDATGTSNSDVDPQASAQVDALFKYDHNQDTPTIPEDMPAGDIMNQHIDEYDGDNDPVEYAHAPCTPGLWEEPNLSNIQETSAYDDHQEPENHPITEFAVKENLENDSSEQHHNQFEPLEKSPPHIATTEQLSLEQSPPHNVTSAEQISLEKSPPHVVTTEQMSLEQSPPHNVTSAEQMSIEKSLPHIVTTEQMSMYDPGSTPFTESHMVDQVRSMSPIAEVSETVVSVVDDPVKVVNLLNENATHQEPEVQTVDDNCENYVVEHQGMSNNITYVVNHENAFHPTMELELNTEPSDEQHNLVTPQDQGFMQPKDSTVPVQSTHDNMPNFDFMGLRPCVTLSNHENAFQPTSSLPPSEFTSLPLPSVETSRREEQEHPSAPILVQGEVVPQADATEPLERNLQETYHAEVGPSNTVVQVASSILPNRQVVNVIERDVQVYNTNSYISNFHPSEKVLSFSQGHDIIERESTTPIHQSTFTSSISISNRQVDSVNERDVHLNNSNSYTTNFPAPEKLLSFSQDLPNNMNMNMNMLPETTPIMAPPGYGGDAGTNNRYSGRKRSITESSMSAQSLNLNLNESSSFYTTNNTKESFRDDDLLSSILVGRNTSILKMKSTPTPTPTPPTEAPSTKRRRQSAPKTAKTGISKRKVLMDDNMVLHGDTIRQQLTNTEDIRRLRKKAPCTHAEISMIEKQFWEDELFGRSIITGMSIKLTSLQRQLYDISKIVVSQYDNASLEGVTDQKSISQNDEKDIQPEMVTENTGVSVEPDVPKENKDHDDNFDPVPMIIDVSEEAQPVDVPKEDRDEDNFDPVVMKDKDVSESQPIDVPKDNRDEDNFDSESQPIDVPKENRDEIDVPKENREEDNFDPVVREDKDVSEAQPIDNNTHDTDNNTRYLDYYENQEQMHTTGDFTQLFGPEHDILEHATAMEMDGNSFQDADVGVSVMHTKVESESLTHADVVPSDTNDMSAAAPVEVEKSSQMVAPLLMGPPPGFGAYERIDVQSANNSIESNVASERKVDDESVREERQEVVLDASTTFSSETDGLKSHIHIDILDTEISNNEEENNLVSNGDVFGEAVDAVDNQVLEDILLDEREKAGHDVTTTSLNLEDIPTDNRVDVDADDDYMYSGVANDTDFLNFDDGDDDEAGEAADDYMPDGEETKMLDNSGWSSRTRAVAKYLQIMFDKEGERGRNLLGVNNLLAGKTRREASRMFFETLVLKTKDYIHVEQTDPFENINVFPRSKLLKSEF
ncbi:unnamed protein product [Lactuca virosa]|uniref:Sister chromatid cohesion 1 protein 4 n=1 Tax=Lactuca virosa TaxID=75947 RepID=A0AAU9NKD0_9ASTR|nr:unnamed protein product [Lactuca virosa]